MAFVFLTTEIGFDAVLRCIKDCSNMLPHRCGTTFQPTVMMQKACTEACQKAIEPSQVMNYRGYSECVGMAQEIALGISTPGPLPSSDALWRDAFSSSPYYGFAGACARLRGISAADAQRDLEVAAAKNSSLNPQIPKENELGHYNFNAFFAPLFSHPQVHSVDIRRDLQRQMIVTGLVLGVAIDAILVFGSLLVGAEAAAATTGIFVIRKVANDNHRIADGLKQAAALLFGLWEAESVRYAGFFGPASE